MVLLVKIDVLTGGLLTGGQTPCEHDLLSNIDSDKSYDVDFDLLSTDREAAQQTYDAMLSLTSQDNQLTMAEKIYLNMAAQKMGIPRE